MRTLIALGVLSLSSTALADKPREAPRIAAHFALGLAGGTQFTSPGNPGLRGDLDATVGIGARFELPVLSFLSVGGFLEWRAAQRDPSPGRDHLFDFDGLIKGRHVIAIGGSLDLEISAGVPVGLTLATMEGLDGAFVGVNFGFLGGGALFINDRVGALVEVGLRYHRIYNDPYSFGFLQFAMNVGGVLLL